MLGKIQLAAMAIVLAVSTASVQADIFGQAVRNHTASTPSVYRLPESTTALSTPATDGWGESVELAGYMAGTSGGCSNCESDNCGGCYGDGCDLCPKNCCRKARVITFGEILYLQPGDVDFTYAIPRNGLAPAGRVGTADPDFNLGFRTGIGWSPDGLQSIIGSFTWFESSTIDAVQTAPGGNVQSQVIHPNTTSAASVFLRATATYDIDFQLADVAYRAVIGQSDRAQIAYSAGLRYARLEENASVLHNLSAFTPTTVTTDIDFEGFGIRFGLDGRRVFPIGLLFYAKSGASFIAGQYDGTYNQVNALNQVEASSDIQDDRIVTILECELGIGWISANERCLFTTGYYFAGWYNALPTNSYIQAVRTTNFVDVSDTLTFSGLVSRVELRF